MSEKWTSEDILHFLGIYEKYDVLWNTQLAEYRDKNARELALGNMLQELNMDSLTLDLIRNKIKMIKTVYNQERNKILKSKKSATGQGVFYKPKLAWFEKADSFLKDVTSNRISNSNLKKEAEEEELEDSEIQDNSVFFCREEKKIPKSNKMPIKKQILRKIPISKLSRAELRKRKDMDIVTNALSKLKSIAEFTNKEEDEFDYFGRYIACQMRQLPILNALHCQEQVLNIITQERIATVQQAEMEASGSQSHWNGSQTDFE